MNQVCFHFERLSTPGPTSRTHITEIALSSTRACVLVSGFETSVGRLECVLCIERDSESENKNPCKEIGCVRRGKRPNILIIIFFSLNLYLISCPMDYDELTIPDVLCAAMMRCLAWNLVDKINNKREKKSACLFFCLHIPVSCIYLDKLLRLDNGHIIFIYWFKFFLSFSILIIIIRMQGEMRVHQQLGQWTNWVWVRYTSVQNCFVFFIRSFVHSSTFPRNLLIFLHSIKFDQVLLITFDNIDFHRFTHEFPYTWVFLFVSFLFYII